MVGENSQLVEEGPLTSWGGNRRTSKGTPGYGLVIQLGRGLQPGGTLGSSNFSFLFSFTLLPPLLSCLLFSPPPSSPFLPSAPLPPGLWLVPSGAEYPSGFRGCLPGVSQRLRRGEDGGGGLRCPLVPERAGGSTMDSVSPVPEARSLRRPCVPAVWAPVPAAGGSRSPPPRLLLPRDLPSSSTNIPESPPASCRRTENPEPGLRVWRPW
jgi:hypothetical protein